MPEVTLDEIRRVVREELDATVGLQEDPEPEDQETPSWMIVSDGRFRVDALLSDNQRLMRENGRHVMPSNQVFIIYHRSALAVRDGTRGIADNRFGEKLRQYMLDNVEFFGTDWIEANPE